MKRLVLALAGVLSGCAWSNSLYQARLDVQDAVRAEREHRPAEAQASWGRAMVRADSAYARNPHGRRGAEALWLGGLARFHAGDCVRATTAFERVLIVEPQSPWRSELLFDLASCREATAPGSAIELYNSLIAASRDTLLLRRSAVREARLFANLGQWQQAITALGQQDTAPARLQRATAYAELGNTGAAVNELSPLIAAGDTTVNWVPYIQLIAGRSPADADTLIARLYSIARVPPIRQGTWLLEAARAAADTFPAASDRWLTALAQRGGGPPQVEGGMLRLLLRLERANSIPQLHAMLDSLRLVGELPEGSPNANLVTDRSRRATLLVTRHDSVHIGAPGGDMAMFALAEYARDTLASPALAREILIEIERGWPRSPYVGKALLARLLLPADSQVTIRARLDSMPANPFVAALHGDISAQLERARLEDSLGRFTASYWTGSSGTANGVLQ